MQSIGRGKPEQGLGSIMAMCILDYDAYSLHALILSTLNIKINVFTFIYQLPLRLPLLSGPLAMYKLKSSHYNAYFPASLYDFFDP